MKKRKLIVLAKHLKQVIFGGPAWQNCRPTTSCVNFKFTKQLLTEVPHRHFLRILILCNSYNFYFDVKC